MLQLASLARWSNVHFTHMFLYDYGDLTPAVVKAGGWHYHRTKRGRHKGRTATNWGGRYGVCHTVQSMGLKDGAVVSEVCLICF